MRKVIIPIIVLLLLSLLGFYLYNTYNKQESNDDTKVIKVAAHLPNMIDILKLSSEEIKNDGYTIDIVQVNDNIQYNELLKNKEVDANFAQHEPFMKKFNQEKNANLKAVQKIYDAKVGFYSKNYSKIEDIPANSKIAIPSDISNEGRALAILNDYGLIRLKDGVGFNGTIKDIVDNPKGFQWLQIDLLNLSEAYPDPEVALVYNYPAYISKLGLSPNNALFLERKIDDRFAICLVAREDNENSDKILALKKAMTSDKVRDFLITNHGDTLIPSF